MGEAAGGGEGGLGRGGGEGGNSKRERGTGLGWTELRSCVNREVGLGSHSHIPFFPTVPNKLYGFCGRKAPGKKKTRGQSSGAVWTGRWAWALNSLSHYFLVPDIKPYMVSVDVKHQERRRQEVRAQELCGQGGGPGLSIPYPIISSSLILSHIWFLWK